MANPTTRSEFAQFCLRALGAPVIEVNVSDEQVEDRIDFSLKTWWDYHFDGSEMSYYKYIIQAKDLPGSLSEITIANGGVGYDNTDIVIVTPDTGTNQGSGANVSITTDANGTIITANIDTIGGGYFNPPTISFTAANGASSNGTGANLVAYNGGYIPIPENIIGAVSIFDIGTTFLGSTANMFNIQYQIALNDMYTISGVQMVPYYLARFNIQTVSEMLIGRQPIRYNRHKNRCYLDMNWSRIPIGTMIIVEAYQIVDPDVYRDSWNDRWLLQYATAQIKKQWGNNLKKYGNMEMPGHIIFNGQKIYDEAVEEIAALEQRMIMDYGIPVLDMIG